MYEGLSNEKDEEEPLEEEIADEVIAHVQELLDDGLYDGEARNEAISMLNKARLSTENSQVIAQIDVLLEDIETRYGDDK